MSTTCKKHVASLLLVPVCVAFFATQSMAGLILTGGGLTLVQEGPVVPVAGDPPPANLATGGTAFVSGELGAELGLGFHLAPNLNDNAYGNSFSWIPGSADPVPFGGISLGATPLANIQSIAFGRNNTLSDPFTDRHLGNYTLQYTTTPNPDATTPDVDWLNIGTLDYGPSDGPGTRYDRTQRRHRFNFDPVDATGLRLLTPGGTAIDEFEIFDVAGDLGPLAAGSIVNYTGTLFAFPFLGGGRVQASFAFDVPITDGLVLNISDATSWEMKDFVRTIDYTNASYAFGQFTFGPDLTPIAWEFAAEAELQDTTPPGGTFNFPETIGSTNIGNSAVTLFSTHSGGLFVRLSEFVGLGDSINNAEFAIVDAFQFSGIEDETLAFGTWTTTTFDAVPEPSSISLLTFGVAMYGYGRRRKRKRANANRGPLQ